ncbi:hypothetical protein [Aristaeella hokkaidonensis]|uniref:Uncharacterized protein n=2 Tax=Aristaeella hokkaidonensis TaxID=3046382 RepID=A0AC61NBV3_9FIRM|nr:hypothetical protein [Aristaeella hokkaidonensis]QUC68111.1 hypothetical protein JYE49_05310 [Aristaeella hokkaidonensis]
MIVMLAVCSVSVKAETAPEGTEEQGLDEIQPLIEMSDVKDTEGMSLEEMTDAFADASMCEYMDSETGFSMQYPAVFQFDEGLGGLIAVSADGKATLSIENMAHDGSLTKEILLEAVKLEVPGFDTKDAETNNCLRVTRKEDQDKMIQTDLYYLTDKSFHHIILRYPSEQEGTYSSYIDYMINTMETSDSELG